jgi:hypothetical protein
MGSEIAMTVRRDPEIEAAIQYLVWALEEIEKTGSKKAAQHARMALDELRAINSAPKAEATAA